MINKAAVGQERFAGTIPHSAGRNPVRDGPFWGIVFGHAMTHWYPSSIYILLPYIVMIHQFSVVQAGFLLTIRSIVNALLVMPIGALTDMTRRKSLLLALSLTMVGLPFLFLGSVESYWLFVLLFIVMGVGNEFWHPASYSTLSALYPSRRGMVFGWHAMASNLGDMLSPVVIGALIAVYPWQDIIVWNFIPGLAFAVFILWILRRLTVDAAVAKGGGGGDGAGSGAGATGHGHAGGMETADGLRDYLRGLKALLSNRPVLLIAVLSGIRAMAQSGIMVLLPLYLAFEIGLDALWVGITVGVLQGGGLVAAPIVGMMSDKKGRRPILMLFMAVTSAMIVIVALIRHEWILIGTIAVLGFFLYAMRPVLQAWAMESTIRKMAGTTTSLLFGIQAAMGAASPVVGSWLAQSYGYTASFYFLAAVILAGNLVMLLIPRNAGTRHEAAAGA